MKVQANKLYVADVQRFFPHRMNIFSLADLSFSHTIKLLANNRNEYDKLEKHSPKQFYPRGDGTFLVSYHRLANEYQDEESLIYYVIQDSTGNIVSGPILEQKDRINLIHDTKGSYSIRVIHSFPFFEKSLFAISGDGYLYTARSKEFKIDLYNWDGEQIRGFQHPFDNKSFDKNNVLERYKETDYMSQLGNGVALAMIREAENLPATWPALETMFFDDENRLWVSTIVEDDEVYEWWVLKDTGEVMDKFEWSRDHPIEAVRNGKLYARETDEETGLVDIVRYDIVFEEE